MKNHNNLLTKLRYQTATRMFNDMTQFATDCICYAFAKPLSYEEQNDFVEFLGDSDHLNSLSPVDFCNYLLHNHIEFTLKFRFFPKIGLKRNYQYYKIIQILRRRLKELKMKKQTTS